MIKEVEERVSFRIFDDTNQIESHINSMMTEGYVLQGSVGNFKVNGRVHFYVTMVKQRRGK